jgi:hypothetical protein
MSFIRFVFKFLVALIIGGVFISVLCGLEESCQAHRSPMPNNPVAEVKR